MDSNISKEEVKTLEKKPNDPNPQQKDLNLQKDFKNRKLRREKDSNLHKEDLNPSSWKMKNKAKDLNLRKKDLNPFIKR